MVKVVVVFGATGRQGGSVASRLYQDSNYKVRAVTRNVNSDKAKALAASGIEVVQADLDDRQSLAYVLEGAYACFVVTDTQFERADCEEYEYSQGENVADVCMVMKVRHVVFSSQPKTFDAVGIQVKHYDAKSRIAEFMRERELPLTTVMVCCYYENFTSWLKPQKIGPHAYQVAIPMGNVSLDAISVTQIGEAVRSILNAREQTLNKNFVLTGDKLTIVEIAKVLSQCLKPNQFIDAEVHLDQYRQMARFVGGDQMANMFEFLKKQTMRANLETTERLIPGVKSFGTWAQENQQALVDVLEK